MRFNQIRPKRTMLLNFPSWKWPKKALSNLISHNFHLNVPVPASVEARLIIHRFFTPKKTTVEKQDDDLQIVISNVLRSRESKSKRTNRWPPGGISSKSTSYTPVETDFWDSVEEELRHVPKFVGYWLSRFWILSGGNFT